MSGQVFQPIKGLNSTKSKVSVTQYNRMVKVVNGLQAIAVDGQGTTSKHTSGNLNTSVPYAADVEEYFHHFTGYAINASPDYSVFVHCGRWSNDIASILCNKGKTGAVTGISELYEDLFEVTGVNADGWIMAKRDESAVTVEPVFLTTFPDASQIGTVYFPLIKVNWDTDLSIISSLEPLWYGGDIVTGGGDSSRHYNVTQKDLNNIIVRGGRTLIGGAIIPLTVASGDGAMYSGKSAEITITASGYICIELDSASAPSAVTAIFHALYPDAQGDRMYPLAYVTWVPTAGAVPAHIGSIEALWKGGDIQWPIRGFRYNTTTLKLQYTFLTEPDPADASTDWVDITTASNCA